MSSKLFLLLISTISAQPVPDFVKINKVDFTQLQNKNSLELYKNQLVKNLIVTSDNLVLFINTERDSNFETEALESPKSFLSDEFTEMRLLEDENFLDLEDPERVKTKRQIGGGGGDTQMVMGTFQAMMRPMSLEALPTLPGSGQNSATQVEQTSPAA